MKIVKIVTIVTLLIWPISAAVPAIPDRPIFEYSGDGHVSFYNTHSDELLEITYKGKKGRYLDDGIDDINYILRCRLTNQQIPINMKLIELIDHIQDHFGGREIEVISGYRSPELNSALRAGGRGVGSRSYHMRGMAIDIRIPGISTRDLRNYVASLKQGGVGYYPGPNFVHVDVGPVRYW